METKPTGHLGRKITKIRELRGMKQEALAQAMGVSQQTISTLENSEAIDDTRLRSVAEALGVSLEGLKQFSEEAVFQIINNTFNSNDNSTLNAINIQPTFNTVDKIVDLYERLLAAEKEKVAYLEKMVGK